MSGHKYRSDKGGKSEKYSSSYRDHEDSGKASYSAAYDDHYSSRSQPSKVDSVKVARKQQHRSPQYDPVYDVKKAHKTKSDYRDEYKDSSSKKMKSKDDYYGYRDERDDYRDEYYEDSHKAVPSSTSSKKYYADDGFKENPRAYHSERSHKELPMKDSYKSKGDPYYDESYKPRKNYVPYDEPAKSYKEYHRDKKYSVSPPRKVTRRSYSFSPPPSKQPQVYDNYREPQYGKSQEGDFRGRGRQMNKPRGDYRDANHLPKPIESDFRGAGPMNKPRMEDFRSGAPVAKARGLNSSNGGRYNHYDAPPPVVEHRGRPYDSFSNSYHEQRDSYYHPEPPMPHKEKKYSQYHEMERPPKSAEPTAQFSRYVIGDSVVYGSPGHYPQGLVSPRRYTPSPPRRSKYPPKEVSLSPPLDGPGAFRQQTPSLSPHYPLYDEPRRRSPAARDNKRKLSLSPTRTAGKRVEGGSKKRPPSPPPPHDSFSSSFKHSRNTGAAKPGPDIDGSTSDRHWSGSKKSSGPPSGASVKQSSSGSLARRAVSPPAHKEAPSKNENAKSSVGEKESGKPRSSNRRSRSPSDQRNKSQRSKHAEDDRSSPSSKKPLLNNPPSPANSQQGLLGAKPPLLCTPPLFALPAPPLMGVRPAMPMIPPMLGRPGGLLDGRLGLAGGNFKRLPGDVIRGGRLGGRGRGNMRRPLDLRGLIESRKERNNQPQMGRFAPPGHRHREGLMPEDRRLPADVEGRRVWPQENRMNHQRGGERLQRNDGRPQQVLPRVRDRLLNRPVMGLRKPLVSRVPRITNRKVMPSVRRVAIGVQGSSSVRPRVSEAASGAVRSNRSPAGGRSNVRGVVPARPKLSAIVSNRTALLKKYQRLTGRTRPAVGEGASGMTKRPLGRGVVQTQRKKPIQQQAQDRDAQRRPDDKAHRKQETDDHRRDDGPGWRRDSGRRDDSRTGRDARDRRENSPARPRRASSHGRDVKKKGAASSPRRQEKQPQRNTRGTLERSPKVSSTTGGGKSTGTKSSKRRLSRSPSSSSSADSYKRPTRRASSASRRDSSGSRYSRSPRHNKFSRSSPSYNTNNSSAPHRRSKYTPSPKPSSKYNNKNSRSAARRSRSRSRSSSGSMSSISRGRKSVSPSLSP